MQSLTATPSLAVEQKNAKPCTPRTTRCWDSLYASREGADCKACKGNLSDLHQSCGEIRNRNSCLFYHTSVSEFWKFSYTQTPRKDHYELADWLNARGHQAHSLETFTYRTCLFYEERGLSLSSRKFRQRCQQVSKVTSWIDVSECFTDRRL